MTTMSDDLKRLTSWAKTLAAKAETAAPVIEEILSGKRVLPEGCPTKESLAAMELGGVQKAFTEVEAAYRDIQKRL
jgi:hypothetical protein